MRLASARGANVFAGKVSAKMYRATLKLPKKMNNFKKQVVTLHFMLNGRGKPSQQVISF